MSASESQRPTFAGFDSSGTLGFNAIDEDRVATP
jgi:hypothetical protein